MAAHSGFSPRLNATTEIANNRILEQVSLRALFLLCSYENFQIPLPLARGDPEKMRFLALILVGNPTNLLGAVSLRA